jgi:hypothetical protein
MTQVGGDWVDYTRYYDSINTASTVIARATHRTVVVNVAPTPSRAGVGHLQRARVPARAGLAHPYHLVGFCLQSTPALMHLSTNTWSPSGSQALKKSWWAVQYGPLANETVPMGAVPTG